MSLAQACCCRTFLSLLLLILINPACGGAEEGAGGGADTAAVAEVEGDISVVEDAGEAPGVDVAGAVDAGAASSEDAGVATVDADKPPDNCPGGPHCVCIENDDCDSALCIDTPEGQRCAQTCVDACEAGFKCAPVSAGGGDTLNICVPKFGLICTPCTASKECLSLGLKEPMCVDQGNAGAFCGISCAAGETCPAGYDCQEATSVEGAKGKQCVRLPDVEGEGPGACECSTAAKAMKLSTTCFIEALDGEGEVIGKCPGLRKCTKSGLSSCIAPPAQAEYCDGVDNDCDGDIDEATCDDGNQCTIDVCDPAKSTDQKEGCAHAPVGAPCDADGNVCTENDLCIAGICTPGKLKDCDDGNPCTKETCHKADGCSKSDDDGAPCDDENPCTLGDTCATGGCISGEVKKCTSSESCIGAKCSLVTGKCQFLAKLDGLPCDDGTACTIGDACAGGNCVGKVKNCDDKNACTDDACDGQSGCTYKANSSPCDDDDACTATDLCKDSQCAGSALDPAVACKDGNACTEDKCDKTLGCINPNNGAGCDDGNPCTEGDACKGGQCESGSNACQCETDSECAKKEDGDLCNGTLICDKSAAPFKCKVDPKTIIGCPEVNNTSCLVNTCLKAKGTCQLKEINAGQPCDADGSVCTAGDLCASGICKPGPLVSCDDDNPCTDDACDKSKGCQHGANEAPCEDGQGCTTQDVCKLKACTPGIAVVCDDKDPCTEDFCDKDLGKCNIKPVAGCGGYCGKVADCDDGNACTDDACAQGKCLVKDNSKPCDDGNKCTENDACGAGKCAGAAATCDDGNACTEGSCNPSIGCVQAAKVGDCEDGNKCTGPDSCAAGKCAGGAEKLCDDSDDCTTDSCDSNTGDCVQAPIIGCGGFCKADKDCDDGSPCTAATCVGGQCDVSLTTQACDDGNPCSDNDTCVAGKCGLGGGVQVASVAGGAAAGFLDGPGTAALLNGAVGVALRPDGALIIADTGNHRIRWINDKGFVGTLAGNGKAGHQDGLGALVQFNGPRAVAADGPGNVYVADTGSHRIRRVSALGVTITVAGSGQVGAADGPGLQASFSAPEGLAVAAGGAIYVADAGNHRVRRIAVDGTVITVAGSTKGFADGYGAQVRFNAPVALALGGQGEVFVADRDNHRVRRLTAEGVVTTFAGSAAGYQDGVGAKAAFNGPTGIAADLAGRLFVADGGNHRLRLLRANGEVQTVAGSIKGWADGAGAKARFNAPAGVAVDVWGSIWLADVGNHRVRTIRDYAGNCKIGAGCWSTGSLNPGNTCQTCDPKTKTDAWTATGVGAACQDGKACTAKDTCGADGKCVGGPISCDDGNKCTLDTCSASGVCVHAAKPGCGGLCKYSVDCDDNNICTEDLCLEGKCGFNFNTKPCKSGGGCTIGDKCALGQCVKGAGIGVATVAGSGYAGMANGEALQAKLSSPVDVAADASGNAFFSDLGNHRIRRLSVDGDVSTYAGSGSAGWKDGPAASASFYNPRGLALNSGGALIVADRNNHRIRVISQTGNVTTLAGYYAGSVDGKGSAARFQLPEDVAVDAAGVIFVADTGNHRIRRIAGDAVSTLAGSTEGYKDGQGIGVQFSSPGGVAVGAKGNIYVADTGNHRVRLVTAKGEAITVAGAEKGFKVEAGKLAQFDSPVGLQMDSAGNLYISDRGNFRLRKMLPNGLVLAIAGASKGYKDGGGAEALFGGLEGIGVAPSGTVYVADATNHRVRTVRDSKDSCAIGGQCWSAEVVNPANICQRCQAAVKDSAWAMAADGKACSDGKGCTVSDACNKGSCVGVVKTCDDGDKCTVDACEPGTGKCAHKAIIGCGGYCQGTGDCDDGNACTNDVCNSGKCKSTFNTQPCSAGDKCSAGDACSLGKCTVGQATEVRTAAGSGYIGFLNAEAPLAKFRYPSGVDYDAAGNLYIADRDNHRIRKVDSNGQVSTLAGTGGGGSADGDGAKATFYGPYDVAVGPQGNVFVAEYNNCRIRRVTPSGVVLTWAGNQYCSWTDAWGTAARFAYPQGLVVDSVGNVYVADTNNSRIRRISPNRTVTTLAGGSSGIKDGTGNQARFNNPTAIDLGPKGDLFVADRGNHRVRRVTTSGAVITIAGTGVPGHLDGQALSARFHTPTGIAVDSAGVVYVSDYSSHRIRRISTNGEVSTLAGNGNAGDVDGLVPKPTFYHPMNLTVEPSGALLVADAYSHRIRRVWNSKGHCLIDGQCYGGDIRNPKSMCQVCTAATAVDMWTALPKGLPCIDASKCTENDACNLAGECTGTLIACDDNDKCTADSCALATGKCVYKPKIGCGGNCSDDAHCDDGNMCTNATCIGGKCNIKNNANPCSAGDPCSLGDHCSGGKCTSGMAVWVSTHAGSGYTGDVNGPKALAQFKGSTDMAFTAKGEMIIADHEGHRIRKIDADDQVTTFAGSGSYSHADGVGTSAHFRSPAGVTVDGAGNVWVTDYSNHVIRRISPIGQVVTIAGYVGNAGSTDGKGSSARFYYPWGLVAAADGSVYVTDRSSHRIRRVSAAGVVNTVAGSSSGYVNGAGSQARFNQPTGIDIDSQGNLFVADTDNHVIRKISPAGLVSTVVGGGSAGFVNGTGTAARFNRPMGLVLGPKGSILVADYSNRRIRQVSAGLVVSTFAGSGGSGSADGLGKSATFDRPVGLALDNLGNLYVADQPARRVRKVINSADNCFIDGQCYTSGINNPISACQFCDALKGKNKWQIVPKNTPCYDGKACTKSDTCSDKGQCEGVPLQCDDSDKCTSDSCSAATGKCVFQAIVGCGGNCGKNADCDDKNACTTDTCVANQCDIKFNSDPCDSGQPCSLGDKCVSGKCKAMGLAKVSTAAGSGYPGYLEGDKAMAKFSGPTDVAVALDGTVYVADTGNHRIRRLNKSGIVSLLAGGSSGWVDGKGSAARFYYPRGVAVDGQGVIYVADSHNHRIRKIQPDGTVSTLAGSKYGGWVDGQGSSARFNYPTGVAATAGGIVYVADESNHRIRRVAQNGYVTTLAGSGGAGHNNGAGSQATFQSPTGLSLDAWGNIFVADYNNHRIRKVTPAGQVTTYAGSGTAGLTDGPASTARFYRPSGIAVDSAGRVWVSDRQNQRIRRVSADGQVSTVAGNGSPSDKDGLGTATSFYNPRGMGAAQTGELYIADESNHRIRKLVDSSGNCQISGFCWGAGLRNPDNNCQYCDVVKTGMAWSAKAEATLCEDGKLCSLADQCGNDGKCAAGKGPNCDDGNKCTADACDEKTGLCVSKPIGGCS